VDVISQLITTIIAKPQVCLAFTFRNVLLGLFFTVLRTKKCTGQCHSEKQELRHIRCLTTPDQISA